MTGTLFHAILAQTGTGLPTTPTTPTPTTTPASTFPTILLTALIFSSMAIAVIILFLPERTRDQRGRIRIMGLVGAAIPMLFTLGGLNFQVSQEFSGGTVSFEEKHAWVTSFPIHIDYHLGVDGISLPLLLLSTVMFTVAVLAAWKNETRPRLFFVLLLLLETGVNGTLCALDGVMFVLFWAMELVPSFLLIAIWGGTGRLRAAQRYLVYGLISTALLLAALLLLAFKSQQNSFDFDLTNTVGLTPAIAFTGFWLSVAAFAIRLPVVPLHTWMPDAVAEASPPVSAIISGVVLKLSAYGLLRITMSAFPLGVGRFSFVLAVFAVVGTWWGFAGALGTRDIKRLLAYISIGQMSGVLLAVSAGQSIALNGAVLLMLANGFGIGLLLLLAGTLEERARTRDITRLGGLVWQMPRLTALWIVGGLTAIGVPFLAGFAAEFMLFTGAFPVHRWATVLVMVGLLLNTGCVLWMLQRVFFGNAREAFARIKDASTLELFYLVPLAAVAVLLGLFPGRLLPIINNGVLSVVSRINGG
ncbi:MAG TPA: NADH-quinone oxidoreductase subunit M [Candidatus Dormibacteraeota bacterium]|jgi:NADH-quinone oxidoreductase subunit M|nr:NADH-quinone oxidoreductase subunit M [Candidatus Dormibacteraeota bacterium]